MSRRRSSALDQLLEKRKGEDASRVAAVDSDIHRLASFGILDVLKVQLEKRGVDVDAVDARNMTALLWGKTRRASTSAWKDRSITF
jgi:ankyrin repeat protein